MVDLPLTTEPVIEVRGGEPTGRGRALGTARFIAAKGAGALVSLLLVVVLGFFLFRALPGNPVRAMIADTRTSVEQIEQMRAEWRLDLPLFQQFLGYLGDLLRGDLGTSLRYKQPVADLIMTRLWPTLLLTGTALVLSVALGLWLGTRAAWRHGSRFDRWSTSTALVLWSVPTFWLGLIMLMVFAVGFDLFPTAGMTSPGGVDGFLPAVLDVAHHLVLPAITLTAVVYAQYLMVMRSSLLEEMNADYLTTARAKGLTDDQVRRRHAVPNALLPTITIIFLHTGLLVAGAVTVETVFTWPGLGLLTFQAINFPDYPLLQGTMIVLAGAVVVMNALADVVYRFLDPRVRQT
ncbi:MAG TPA: ABC transporter permease [Actinophytocola sp.]|uniref:ABC transporter permease n=1 Tax=Actinophytocola sp. TaxID=1872138 RepID=UPI002DB984AE|nr:ABC transporter permease [Actinophytocola sp.]HEU5474682.1 ABC transporter permease [Actinophytocola sp.]